MKTPLKRLMKYLASLGMKNGARLLQLIISAEGAASLAKRLHSFISEASSLAKSTSHMRVL